MFSKARKLLDVVISILILFNNLTIILFSLMKDSTNDIREALNTLDPRLGKDYDPELHFKYDHIRTTVADW